jgi:hypothetical protein
MDRMERSMRELVTAVQTVGPELGRRLGELARGTGRSHGELLCDALAEYLDRRERPAMPSFVGAVAGGTQRTLRAGSSRRSHDPPGDAAA